MIGIKIEERYSFDGVTFGLASYDGMLAIASSKLRFFSRDKVISSIKAKCACTWERGIIASDGLRVFIWNGKEFKVLKVGEHAKVMASEDELLVCNWTSCRAYSWDLIELWKVEIEGAGFATKIGKYWYLPGKNGLYVIDKGHIINVVDVENSFKAVGCTKGIALASSNGVTLLSLDQPERPEPLTFLEAKGVLFDIALSKDCSYLTIASSKGIEILSRESFHFPTREAVTAVTSNSLLYFSIGEYDKSTIIGARILNLESIELGKADWVKSSKGKVIVVKDNCVENVCLENVLDVDTFPLTVAGEGIVFNNNYFDLGLVTSVATDGKGFLACNEWSCTYYNGDEKWSIAVEAPRVASFGKSFLVACRNGIMIVEDGKIVKRRSIMMGDPLNVSVSDDKALISFSRGSVIIDKNLNIVWAIEEKSFRSSFDNDYVLIVNDRAKLFVLGDPLPLDLGNATSGALADDIYLVKDNKLIKTKRPKLAKRNLPQIISVMGFDHTITGIAKGCGVAIATPQESYLVYNDEVKKLEGFNDVYYYDNRYIFVNEEKALIMDCSSKLKIEIETGFGIGKWVVANEVGFLTCGDIGCMLHTWEGEVKEVLSVAVSGKPLALERDFIIPTRFGIFSSSKKKELALRDPLSVGTCSNELLVGGEDAIFIVSKDLEFLKELQGFNRVIAAGCNLVVEESGRVVLDREEYMFPEISSVLISDSLYIGTKGGLVYMVNINRKN